MNSRTAAPARHRKASRPLTPLAAVAPMTRRGLAVAASSGLALTMIASGASAAGSTEIGASAGQLKDAGVGAIAAGAREAVTTNAAVSVSSDVKAPASLTVAPEVTASAPVVEEAPAAETTAAAETTTAAAATTTQAAETQQAQAATTQTATTQESQASTTVAASANGSAIVAIALQYVGVPYVSGGSTPSGWDCSGFVQWVYAQVGISLPRTSYAQGASGTIVSAAQAQPGDIVYYGGHVGIYAGNGMMIDAGNTRVNTSYRAVYGSPVYVHIG